MAMCIVRLTEVTINLDVDPAVTIVLPQDYRRNYVSDAKGRNEIQGEADREWIAGQLR